MSSDNTSKDTSAHPMYYTEAYHRAQVDKDLYAIKAGIGGAAVGALGGTVGAGYAMNAKIKDGLAHDILSANKHLLAAAEHTLTKGQRLGIRVTGAILGAVVVGTVAAKIGSVFGYLNAIANGPRPQQLNGWTGKIENAQPQSSEKVR